MTIDAELIKCNKEELLKCEGLFAAWKLGVINACEQTNDKNILVDAQNELKEERHMAEDIFHVLFNNCKSDLDRKILSLCCMIMQTHSALEC